MTGSPAVPTAAPSGKLAAVASVAAVGVVPALGAEVEVDEESLGVLPSDGVVVDGAAGGAAEALPEPAESCSPLNLTPVRSASVLSWTRSEGVSASDGTAFPSTTRRP